MSTQLSSRTWPIRSVQVQLGSVAHPKNEPPLRAASGSQEDPEHRRANLNPPRTSPLTMQTLAVHGEDSLQRLRRRVEASIARSSCPAPSSTVFGGGPEEQEDLRRRMDHKSTVGEDGEVPLDALATTPHVAPCRLFLLILHAPPSPPSCPSLPLPCSSGGGPGGTRLTLSSGHQHAPRRHAQERGREHQERRVTRKAQQRTWSCCTRVCWVVYNFILFTKKKKKKKEFSKARKNGRGF